MKAYSTIVVMLSALFVIGGCSNNKTHEEHLDDIREYIAGNNIDAIETESGLFYSITNEGNGAKPTENSDVRVNYRGQLLEGNVFDQHESQEGLRLNLQQVIEGWREGLVHFPEGSSGILLVPPSLGYGENRVGNIPPNSVLIFDITLLRVF